MNKLTPANTLLAAIQNGMIDDTHEKTSVNIENHVKNFYRNKLSVLSLEIDSGAFEISGEWLVKRLKELGLV